MPATLILERHTPDFTVRMVRYSANLAMPRHAHDEDAVSIVLHGAVAEEAHHSEALATAGWTVVKPAGTIHENRFGPAGATMLSLVPKRTLDTPLLAKWMWRNRPGLFRSALRVAASAHGEARGDKDDDVVTEFIASLHDENTVTASSPQLRDIKHALDNVFPAASVAELAGNAAMHPVYLARRFRATFGVSIREYRKIAQVRRAIQLVCGTQRPLSEIAHACGFADHSHMCRAFRTVARINPCSLRVP